MNQPQDGSTEVLGHSLRELPALRIGASSVALSLLRSSRGRRLASQLCWNFLRGLLRRSVGSDLTSGRAEPSPRDLRQLRFCLISLYLALRIPSKEQCEATVQKLYQLDELVRTRFDRDVPPESRARLAAGGYPGPKAKDALLYCVLTCVGKSAVVETGVDHGVSTTFILAAMEAVGGGHLTSIDIGAETAAGKPVGWVVPDVLTRRWTLQLGRAERLLPQFSEGLQIFLHDSLHSEEHMTFELEWAYERLRSGGLILCDDVNENTAFSHFLDRHPDGLRAISRSVVGVAERFPALRAAGST